VHAITRGVLRAHLLLIGLLAAGGLVVLTSGAVRAEGPNGNVGHGRHHKPVEALMTVASTEMSDLVNGVSSRNLWKSLKTGSSFSAATVRDLYLYVYWRHLSGEHTMTLLIYGPDQNLYEQRVLPIATGSSSSRRHVHGGEGIVDVQPTRPYGRYEVSTAQLPVAGTWITGHRLLGTWRVDVVLDEAATPVVSGTFAITE
jgi:hypothetical protein